MYINIKQDFGVYFKTDGKWFGFLLIYRGKLFILS